MGLLLEVDEQVVIEDENENTRTFSRKDVAAVHAVDLWDDITDETITEG